MSTWKSIKKRIRKSLKVDPSDKGFNLVKLEGEDIELTNVNLQNAPKVILFDFGSVIRVKTAERPKVIASLKNKLQQKLIENNIEVTFPENEKAFKKMLKASDWKETVGTGLVSRVEGWTKGIEALGLAIDTDEMRVWLREFIHDLDFSGKEVMVELRQFLLSLRQIEGVHIGVLSNHSMELYNWLKVPYNLIPAVFDEDMVLVSAKLKIKKPEPAIYQLAFDMLKEKVKDFDLAKHKANVLFIDNKEINCTAARESGMKSFNYLHKPDDPSSSFQEMQKQILDHLAIEQ